MNGINIYFAGPDGVGKTLLAVWLRSQLLERDTPTVLVQFPAPVSPMTSLITLHKLGRTHFDSGTLDLMFVTDRLDVSGHKLVKIREENPETIFIFDRGPLDGAVYGAARLASVGASREKQMGHIRWIQACDRKFTDMYPVDLGFLVTMSVEEAQQRMNDMGRTGDIFDRNTELQKHVINLFEVLIGDDPVWKKIEITSGLDLALEKRRVLSTVEEKFGLRKVIRERG